MHYRYNLHSGTNYLKTKFNRLRLLAVATLLTLPLAGIFTTGVNALGMGSGYSLFGDATVVTGGNPGHAVRMVSDTTDTFGGVDYTVPSGLKLSQLTTLSTDYKITTGDCGGGSPRFQVNINGKNLFVYIGPSPSYTGCALNTWESTGNLLTSPDARFDTSQFDNGNFYSSYQQAFDLLGDQTVTGIQLVTDGGWAVTGNNQTVLADNTRINDTLYTYEPISAKDSCKNGGWQNLLMSGTFKNQGDCVSFFATNGKNQPSGQHAVPFHHH